MRGLLIQALIEALVEEQLQVLTLAEKEFTAYDVTCAVRKTQPAMEIPHNMVRELVHDRMSYLVSAGLYRASMQQFGQRAAVLYGPAWVTVWPDGQGIPNLAVLHLN